jgi:hypothetical protein
VQDSGCITHPDIKPIPDSCHQVIGAFSRKCRRLPPQLVEECELTIAIREGPFGLHHSQRPVYPDDREGRL